MTIEDAIILAAERHRGQSDQAGEPYILHPLRVAQRLTCTEGRLAAVLHDILEDTHTTADELRDRGAPAIVVATVERLSKRRGETYPEFIERIRPYQLASEVKLADLADNLDPRRLAVLEPATRTRLREKYEGARERLRSAWPELPPGHGHRTGDGPA